MLLLDRVEAVGSGKKEMGCAQELEDAEVTEGAHAGFAARKRSAA